MRISNWGASITAAAAILALPMAAQATAVTYDLSFETSGQSIWDTGESFTLDQTTFIGAQWEDKGIEIGGIAFENDTVPNPVRVAYDLALSGCTALGFSASACINGQSARVPVPRLGSRPGIRSCGRYAVGCKIARVGDYAKRKAYDIALGACKALGNSTSTCRNGQSARLPVIALGTAPPATLSAATGAKLEATSDGRVGLELGIEIDSGSVDATVSYQATLDIPDTAPGASRTINFNPNSALAGANTLDTSFANLELSVDAIMELSGSVGAEACLIAAGCVRGDTVFDIAETAPILSFNEGGEGNILLLGQSPSDFGLPAEADGFPFELKVPGVNSDLATVTLHLPQPDATGGLDAGGEKLTATGQDDLVDLILDVDNIIATAAGVPGLFGSSLPSLKIGDKEVVSASFDIVNVEMGPTVDLKQDFELTPTLWVELLFDQAVMIGGELVTMLQSAWDLLPDITFLSDATTVTPTFFLEADLLNETLLDFDLEFMIDLLQISYDIRFLDDGTIGVGNILEQGVDLFESPPLFSKLFDLQGFDLQIGEAFVIDFVNGSSGPSSSDARSEDNPIILAAIASNVPETGTLLLWFAGLFGLYTLRRRTLASHRGVRVIGARRSVMA